MSSNSTSKKAYTKANKTSRDYIKANKYAPPPIIEIPQIIDDEDTITPDDLLNMKEFVAFSSKASNKANDEASSKASSKANDKASSKANDEASSKANSEFNNYTISEYLYKYNSRMFDRFAGLIYGTLMYVDNAEYKNILQLTISNLVDSEFDVSKLELPTTHAEDPPEYCLLLVLSCMLCKNWTTATIHYASKFSKNILFVYTSYLLVKICKSLSKGVIPSNKYLFKNRLIFIKSKYVKQFLKYKSAYNSVNIIENLQELKKSDDYNKYLDLLGRVIYTLKSMKTLDHADILTRLTNNTNIDYMLFGCYLGFQKMNNIYAENLPLDKNIDKVLISAFDKILQLIPQLIKST